MDGYGAQSRGHGGRPPFREILQLILHSHSNHSLSTIKTLIALCCKQSICCPPAFNQEHDTEQQRQEIKLDGTVKCGDTATKRQNEQTMGFSNLSIVVEFQCHTHPVQGAYVDLCARTKVMVFSKVFVRSGVVSKHSTSSASIGACVNVGCLYTFLLLPSATLSTAMARDP